jgi:hypothetical protein
LHLGSGRGGRTAAVLMSLVLSCKRLENEPFAYLQDVLERVGTHRASRVDDLLPDRRVLPEPSALAGRRSRPSPNPQNARGRCSADIDVTFGPKSAYTVGSQTDSPPGVNS